MRILDDELGRALERPEIRSALAVVVDPRDGRVIAMQSREGATRDPELPARDVRPHGSVAKSFSIALALDRGVVQPSDTFEGAPLALGGASVSDSATHGTMSLEDVVAFSSNVGATQVFERLGRAELLAGLAAFHLGHRVPDAARDDDAVAARVAYGAELSATPLEVASAFAAIADGGVVHTPWRRGEAPTPGEHVISAEAAQRAMALLEASVAREDGTGRLARVPGARVAGKTGTVPLDETATQGAFVGAVPSDAPRFVVLVDVIAEGHDYSGGTLAAPVFAAIAERLLAE